MGVHGLWRLLDASGKPVALETLDGKVLAIDVSIWIHQVLQGYQDRRGNAVPNAHLLGLFHRICKLLYFKIRPVFVFDGGVPMLKKNTIASRKKQKAIASTKAQRMKNDLMQNLLKHTAVKGALASASGEKSGNASQSSSSISAKNVDSTNDMFKLPNLPSVDAPDETLDDYESYDSDSSVELSPRKQSRWIGNIHSVDVTSADFKALPADVRYDVLTDLKETRKQNSWGRLHEMPDESHEFSNYQMKRLLKRRQVQESLETAEKEMGGRTLTLEELEKLLSEQGIDTSGRDTAFRIASDSTTRLIFVNDPKGLKRNPSDEASSSQTPSQADRSNETLGSRESDGEEARFAESVIENINEYDLGDSDWESDNEALMPVKSVEPSPLLTKKYFGKQVLNPALAYMMEHAGLPQDQILAIIEGNKKQSANTEETRPLEASEKKSTIDEPNVATCCTKLFSDSDDLIEIPEGNIEILEKSSSEVEAMNSIPANPVDAVENNSISSVKPISSDSDTDSDLVEIQDVPIPEVNFGLEITVKPDRAAMDEDDIFADVFESSNAKAEDTSSARDSTASLSFQDVDEATPTKESENASPIVDSQDSSAAANVSAEPEPDKSDVVVTTEVSVPEVPTDELSERVAKFKPELLEANREKLVSMEAELESEHSELTENIGKLERQATAVTEQMRLEAQDLLRLFGIPYVVAPMEAEAQCAHLENIQLTDGTITDDSDIWLFGGRCVYKNFFNNNKRVMEYKSSDIEHHFKLTREQMIQLALLVGSDYTIGVSGIGPVTALEILAAFPSEGDNVLQGLTSFCSWITSGRSAGPGRTGLRTKLRNVQIERGFPSQAVVQAYLFPTVDESKEAFTWSKPNLTLLADYTRQKFGWTKLKFEETMSPVVKKLAESKSQKGIASYFSVNTVPKSIETTLSKRVKRAVQRLANGAIGEESNDDETEASDPTKEAKRRRGKGSKNQAAESRLVEEEGEELRAPDAMSVGSELLVPSAAAAAKGSTAGTSAKGNGKNVDEYIPQREKDKANALKKKLRAIEVFRKSKKGPGKTKKAKRPARNVMKEAQLSESSESS